MDTIQKLLEEIVTQLFDIKVTALVAVAPENTGADYASNIAMQLAKIVHKAPMVIAEMIRAELHDDNLDVQIATPGFLNFTIKSDELIAKAKKYATDLDANISQDEYSGQTVIAEFSDPNPFKVLHVGHLYTSIVGDSISRLLEFSGAKVIRANFGGDVGLHVAKTLYSVLTTAPQTMDISDVEFQSFLANLTIEDIARCYVSGTRAYEEDEAAKSEITRLNKEIYHINAESLHDSVLAQLYWRGRELSYQYFDVFYARIGVKFDKYYPESSVAERGLREVRAHTGTTYTESDGAVVYEGEKVGLHTRVFINREGVPTYEAKDVGLIFAKWDDWHFDESVVITGNEQSDYMKVVLASVSEYAPQLVDRTRHLTHGLVKLPGNVKMSSRKGNFLKAVDVLDLVRETLGGNADEKILMAAIKYAFLKYKMGGDIVFDPQESVSTTGNSGVYLLYSAVRAKKILQKCGHDVETFSASSQDAEHEKILSKKLVQYPAVLREAVRDKAPYKICTYLYELAQEFSRFYEHVKVAGSENETELAQIVRAYLNVMEHGLSLLGIEVPDEM